VLEVPIQTDLLKERNMKAFREHRSVEQAEHACVASRTTLCQQQQMVSKGRANVAGSWKLPLV
jgi:hypothetical protein